MPLIELDAAGVFPHELTTPQALDEYARVVYRCVLDELLENKLIK